MRFVSGVAFTKGRRPTMEDSHFVCDDVRPLLAKRAKFLEIPGDILEVFELLIVTLFLPM